MGNFNSWSAEGSPRNQCPRTSEGMLQFPGLGENFTCHLTFFHHAARLPSLLARNFLIFHGITEWYCGIPFARDMSAWQG